MQLPKLTRAAKPVLVILAITLGAAPLQAGWLVTTALHWKTFSFAPVEEEATPNYYGYGGQLNFGYSFNQVFDLAVFGNYTPGQLKNPEIGQEDASLMGYGGELGLRLFKAIYFAGRGGSYKYNLIHQHKDEEVDGRWQGTGGELAIGAIFSMHKSKTSYWQVSLDYGKFIMQNADDPETGARKIDAISVNFGYVFNSFNAISATDGIFRDFLNSLGF